MSDFDRPYFEFDKLFILVKNKVSDLMKKITTYFETVATGEKMPTSAFQKHYYFCNKYCFWQH